MNVRKKVSIKKFLFGLILVLIGFAFSFISFYYVINNPCVVNGKEGLYVTFVHNHLLIPFLLSSLVCLCGIFICWYESYKK